jgi:hypothetical protein
VAAKSMPLSSLILGIDLAPIKPVRGTKSLLGDITTPAARQAIRREAGGSLFDVVLHDGAPNVSGGLVFFVVLWVWGVGLWFVELSCSLWCVCAGLCT